MKRTTDDAQLGGEQPGGTERAEAGTRKVACVGDSITRGTFVWRRRKRSYPARLQVMLGARFLVRNFGVNGHAVQRSADRPYQQSDAFAASCDFQPDIVVIMLGTNDSRGDNWKGVAAFADDYRALVVRYQSLESSPTVWLLTPPTLFTVGRRRQVHYGMDARAVREMCPVIEDLARELGCGFVDINEVTAGHPEAFRFDGVHPQAPGAALIADAVYAALMDARQLNRES